MLSCGIIVVNEKRSLIILAAILFTFVTGCLSEQQDRSSIEAANLPPEPVTPPKSISNPMQSIVATQEVLTETRSMPTAIAYMVDAIFSDPPAVAPATMVPTAAPSASPVPTPCSSPGHIVSGTYQSKTAGLSAYRIYLPPCYQPDGPAYPTLYMLPGNIHSDSIWDNLGLDEAAEAAINRGNIPPLLIVMADSGFLLNNTSGGPQSYETQIMEDLIPFIENNYCAWAVPRGRAIGGLSRGGYWALEIAFRNPQHFVSVGGHSASLFDLYGGEEVNPQYTGLANNLGELRMYFDVGRDDWVKANIEKLHEDMETAGIAHEWTVNEGRHEEAYWASHTVEYINWYAEPWPIPRDAYPDCR